MRQDIKERWVEALRSGEYRQGRGRLRQRSTIHESDEYCCLGVLCDLYARDQGVKWEKPNYFMNASMMHGNTRLLPKEVVAWAGLSEAGLVTAIGGVDYDVRIGDQGWASSDYNDAGTSFEEIAALIEGSL